MLVYKETKGKFAGKSTMPHRRLSWTPQLLLVLTPTIGAYNTTFSPYWNLGISGSSLTVGMQCMVYCNWASVQYFSLKSKNGENLSQELSPNSWLWGIWSRTWERCETLAYCSPKVWPNWAASSWSASALYLPAPPRSGGREVCPALALVKPLMLRMSGLCCVLPTCCCSQQPWQK